MIRYKWYRRNYYEYQPMGTEDVSVFHDIPLVIYENTRKYGGVKKVKHQIIGLHRRETALVEMSDIDRKPKGKTGETDAKGMYEGMVAGKTL